MASVIPQRSIGGKRWKKFIKTDLKVIKMKIVRCNITPSCTAVQETINLSSITIEGKMFIKLRRSKTEQYSSLRRSDKTIIHDFIHSFIYSYHL